MTERIDATAPGKLVVAGEYAVIEGAPALSMAVDRRATVSVSEAHEGSVLEVVTADRSAFPFVWNSNGTVEFAEEQPGPRGSLLEAALAELASSLPAAMPDVHIVIDTGEFFAPDGQKLGMGSSAAACVALVGALHRLFGLQQDLAGLCFDIHRRFQSGQGSGIDVATSIYGGLIQFQRMTDTQPVTGLLGWLPGLYVVPVWTGGAASTTAMLARLEQLQTAEPSRYLGLMGELSQIATQLRDEWTRSNVPAVLDLLAMYGYGLSRLDEVAEVGIYSQVHKQFQRRAASMGAVYKPSGAGGGDFGLVFTDSSAAVEQLAAEFEHEIVLSDWSATSPGLTVT